MLAEVRRIQKSIQVTTAAASNMALPSKITVVPRHLSPPGTNSMGPRPSVSFTFLVSGGSVALGLSPTSGSS